mmetsp:Transcript_35249/g.101526  ORF Transcript_35249/g.101526 Transcript_35249/m.101526 type:complete len:586 (-) Transcript_35249:1873-3630(-)
MQLGRGGSADLRREVVQGVRLRDWHVRLCNQQHVREKRHELLRLVLPRRQEAVLRRQSESGGSDHSDLRQLRADGSTDGAADRGADRGRRQRRPLLDVVNHLDDGIGDGHHDHHHHHLNDGHHDSSRDDDIDRHYIDGHLLDTHGDDDDDRDGDAHDYIAQGLGHEDRGPGVADEHRRPELLLQQPGHWREDLGDGGEHRRPRGRARRGARGRVLGELGRIHPAPRRRHRGQVRDLVDRRDGAHLGAHRSARRSRPRYAQGPDQRADGRLLREPLERHERQRPQHLRAGRHKHHDHRHDDHRHDDRDEHVDDHGAVLLPRRADGGERRRHGALRRHPEWGDLRAHLLGRLSDGADDRLREWPIQRAGELCARGGDDEDHEGYPNDFQSRQHHGRHRHEQRRWDGAAFEPRMGREEPGLHPLCRGAHPRLASLALARRVHARVFPEGLGRPGQHPPVGGRAELAGGGSGVVGDARDGACRRRCDRDGARSDVGEVPGDPCERRERWNCGRRQQHPGRGSHGRLGDGVRGRRLADAQWHGGRGHRAAGGARTVRRRDLRVVVRLLGCLQRELRQRSAQEEGGVLFWA